MTQKYFYAYEDAQKWLNWVSWKKDNVMIIKVGDKYLASFDPALEYFETTLETKARERDEKIDLVLGI